MLIYTLKMLIFHSDVSLPEGKPSDLVPVFWEKQEVSGPTFSAGEIKKLLISAS